MAVKTTLQNSSPRVIRESVPGKSTSSKESAITVELLSTWKGTAGNCISRRSPSGPKKNNRNETANAGIETIRMIDDKNKDTRSQMVIRYKEINDIDGSDAKSNCIHCCAVGYTKNMWCNVCDKGEFEDPENVYLRPQGWCHICMTEGYQTFFFPKCPKDKDTLKYPVVQG